jgi:cytokinesis protein
MEETRKRNEASMARKRANAKTLNPAAANSGAGTPDGPLSPSSTGAMDSLLEKLRAAAPQARDQRDRRRRARLKDKHQIRVASGQTIPDVGDLTKTGDEDLEADKPLLSPTAATNGEERMDPISEGEDVAERAASMLQGLRRDGDGDVARPGSRDGSGSLRVRRRRESADDERKNRRRRRARESSSTAGDDPDATLTPRDDSGTLPEIKEPGDEDEEGADELTGSTPPPKMELVPPSPEGSEKKPVVLDD